MRPLLILLTATLMLPATSPAQVGGLIKRGAGKAAERAVDKAVDKAVDSKKPTTPAPKFDDEVLELTNARIDQVVRGIKAFNDARAKADVSGAMKAYEAAQARSSDYSTRYSEQRQAFEEKAREVTQCRADIIDAQHDANRAAMDEKMQAMQTDPAKMRAMSIKAMEWNPKLAALQTKGDTAGLRAAMAQMQRELAVIAGVTVDVDSSKADTKCGKPPRAPAWLAAWDSTDAEVRALGARVREAEMAGQGEAVAASGLTDRQFHVARERIEDFVKDGTMGFSKAERTALGARKAELKAYFPAE